MANGEPDKAEREFYSRRIRIASAFKLATGGHGEITCELYGETEEDHLNYRPAQQITKAEAEEKKARLLANRKVSNFNNKLAKTKRAQAKTGGTHGITIVPHTEKTRLRWRAHVDKAATSFECAISAALFRNAAMAKKHPGHPVFLVNLEAVWEKWGCACGKHTKGHEHAGEDAERLQRNARTKATNRLANLSHERRARLASS